MILLKPFIIALFVGECGALKLTIGSLPSFFVGVLGAVKALTTRLRVLVYFIYLFSADLVSLNKLEDSFDFPVSVYK